MVVTRNRRDFDRVPGLSARTGRFDPPLGTGKFGRERERQHCNANSQGMAADLDADATG